MKRFGLRVLAVSLVAVGLGIPLPGQEPAAAGAGGVRVAAWNIQFGSWCTPEEAAEFLKPLNLDVVGLGETPAGDWAQRMAKALGMEHVALGKLTPYPKPDHPVKLKALLSRTPLKDIVEHDLGNGWAALQAHTTVRSVEISVYALHIGGTPQEACQERLAKNVLPKDKSPNIVVMGDFNATVDGDHRKRKMLMGPIMQAGLRPIWTDLNVDVSKTFSYYVAHPTKGETPAKYTDAFNISSYGVIDHIMISGKLGAVKGGLFELNKANPLSDHKPVWAELVEKK